MPEDSTPTPDAEAAPPAEAEPAEGAVPPLPPGARIIRSPRHGPVVNPQVKEALRNQSRTRTTRQVMVTAVAEIRGDGEEGAVVREAVTLWTADGRKIADMDNVSLASLFPSG
jgi:hypothetical protein